MKVVHELCCGTVDELEVAAEVGVDRVELCCALACGGLTPTPAMVRRAKRLGLETMAMVRSKEGGFCYSDAEYQTMLDDVKWLLDEEADGLVFGFLSEDGELDLERTHQLVGMADGRPTMVHRASDRPADIDQTVEKLVSIGVSRVLTSGQGGVAEKGHENLARLVKSFGDKIQIVAGGGIRPENVIQLVEATMVPAIHYAARKSIDQPGYAGIPEVEVDIEMVRETKALLDAYEIRRDA